MSAERCRREQFSQKSKRPARENRSGNMADFRAESGDAEEHGERERPGINGEGEKHHTDDIREMKCNDKRDKAVQNNDYPGARNAFIFQIPAGKEFRDDDRWTQERRIRGGKHHAQKRDGEHGEKKTGERLPPDSDDLRPFAGVKTRAEYAQVSDDSGDDDKRPRGRENRPLRRSGIPGAENPGEHIRPRGIRGAVSEEQQEKIQGGEVPVERKRRGRNRGDHRARESEGGEKHKPRDDEYRLQKIRFQNGELPAGHRIRDEHEARAHGAPPVGNSGETLENFRGGDNLRGDDSRPCDRDDDGRGETRALTVNVFHHVRKRETADGAYLLKERKKREEARRAAEHEPRRSAAENRSFVNRANDRGSAEDRRREASRHKMKRAALVRDEKVSNRFNFKRAAEAYCEKHGYI